jgi:hypothetical protein
MAARGVAVVLMKILMALGSSLAMTAAHGV